VPLISSTKQHVSPRRSGPLVEPAETRSPVVPLVKGPLRLATNLGVASLCPTTCVCLQTDLQGQQDLGVADAHVNGTPETNGSTAAAPPLSSLSDDLTDVGAAPTLPSIFPQMEECPRGTRNTPCGMARGPVSPADASGVSHTRDTF
jgi:hypothetical protein